MATFQPNSRTIYANPSTYTPDFSFLDTMLKRKEDQYKQGFAKVSQKYSNLAQDLTHYSNIEERDTFLKKAKDNLKDLSSMDLSQQQNVEEAANVFSPLYENKNIIGDMMLTKHYANQENIAESFRLKDNGKEYSEDNINYVRLQRQQFAKDNADSWSSYYNNRASYVPYYDWNKEMDDKMKEYHTTKYSSYDKQGVGPYDWHKFTRTLGADPDSVRIYLDGVLSEKAKKQMQIEATVRLGQNPDALVQVYSKAAEEGLAVANKKVEQLDVLRKTTKDKVKRKEYEDIYIEFEKQRDEYKNQVDAFKSGDTSVVTNNLQKSAFDVYYNSQLSRLAKGYSQGLAKDSSDEITTHDSALRLYINGRDEYWKRKEYDQRERFRKEDEEKENKFIKGDVNLGEKQKDGFSYMTDNLTSAKSQQATESNKLIKLAVELTKNQASPITEKDLLNDKKGELMKGFIATYGNHNGVREILDRQRMLGKTIYSIETQIGEGKEAVFATYTQEQKNQYAQYEKDIKALDKKMPNITIGGKIYSTADLARGMRDGSIKYERDETIEIVNAHLIGHNDTRVVTNPDIAYLTIGDKKIKIDRKGKNIFDYIENTYNKVYNNYSKVKKKYDEDLKKVFGNPFTMGLQTQTYGENSKNTKEAKSMLNNLIPNVNIEEVTFAPAVDAVIFTPTIKEGSKKSIDDILTDFKAAHPTIDAGKTGNGKMWIKDPAFIKNSVFEKFTPEITEIIKTDMYKGVKNKNYTYPIAFYPLSSTKDQNGRPLPSFTYKRISFSDNEDGYLLYKMDEETGRMKLINTPTYTNLSDLMLDAMSLSTLPQQLKELTQD